MTSSVVLEVLIYLCQLDRAIFVVWSNKDRDVYRFVDNPLICCRLSLIVLSL